MLSDWQISLILSPLQLHNISISLQIGARSKTFPVTYLSHREGLRKCLLTFLIWHNFSFACSSHNIKYVHKDTIFHEWIPHKRYSILVISVSQCGITTEPPIQPPSLSDCKLLHLFESHYASMAFTFSLPLSSGGGGIGGRGLPFVSKLEKSSTSSACKNTQKIFVRKSFRLLHISLVRKFPISGFPIPTQYMRPTKLLILHLYVYEIEARTFR